MNAVLVVFLKECRESLRDRRVLLNVLILGPLLGPLLFTMLLHLTLSREIAQSEAPLPVVVLGAEYAPTLVAALRQGGVLVQPAVPDLEAAVREQRIALALRISPGFAEAWRAGRPAQVDIVYDSSRRDGGAQVQRLRSLLENYSRRIAAMRLIVRGLSPSAAAALLLAERDQATPQARGALLFGMLPYFLILTSFIGGMWLALDATAGERDRHTLEALLTLPIARWQLVLGKSTAASSFSFASLVLGLLAFALAAQWLPAQRLEMSLNLGLGLIPSVLGLMLPLVCLIVIVQMLVAAYARSYREAQTYLGLLQLLPVIPSIMISVLPFTPRLWMYAVPLIGQQLALARLLRAESLPALPLALCSLATLLIAAAAFVATTRLYASERLALGT
jgi:sodium transport system permease protein